MPSTTRYRRGDIVLLSFPFTDLSSSKRRPALVISPDSYNEQGQDVVLIAITSQEPDDNVVTIEEHEFLLAACFEPSQVLHPTGSMTLHITQYEMLRSGC